MFGSKLNCGVNSCHISHCILFHSRFCYSVASVLPHTLGGMLVSCGCGVSVSGESVLLKSLTFMVRLWIQKEYMVTDEIPDEREGHNWMLHYVSLYRWSFTIGVSLWCVQYDE